MQSTEKQTFQIIKLTASFKKRFIMHKLIETSVLAFSEFLLPYEILFCKMDYTVICLDLCQI